MKKKMTSMLALALAVITVVSLLSGAAPAAQAAQVSLDSEIEQQVNAYIASLGKVNAGAARNKLMNHALFGKGAYLHMEATDVFTIGLLNSNLLRPNLTETLAEAVRYLQNRDLEVLYIGGGAAWYDNKMSFTTSVYSKPLDDAEMDAENDAANSTDSGSEEDTENTAKKIVTLVSHSLKNGWKFSPNACDSAMVDVVGGSRVRITLRRTALTVDSITYHAELKVSDDFDFNGSQNSASDLGNWLVGSSFIDTYSWDAAADFSFTVTNPCAHKTSNYRWGFNGIDVVSDSADGTVKNPLTKIQTRKSTDGTLYNPYYRTDKAVFLNHKLPWILEMRVQGSANLMLAASKSYVHEETFLLKGSTTLYGGYTLIHKEFNEEKGKEVTKYTRHQYGINFGKLKYKYKDWHTFRLENRLLEDGSNMVYLLVDGNDLGPMVDYYISVGGVQNTTGTWFAGKDFCINFIGNNSFKINPEKISIEYIQIWENGADNAPYSYFETTAAAPTCTEPGKTVHTCSLCGASYSEATGESALGHTLEAIPGTAATCEADGLTEGSKCTTCGETVTAQEVIPALGHDWDEGAVTTAATCTSDGILTYTCANDSAHTKTEPIPATGHIPGEGATCIAPQSCTVCGIELGAAVGHSWNEGETVTRPSPEGDGLTRYTCLTCGEIREEVLPYEGPVRIAGRDRFETALLAADKMKANMGIEKFDAVVVASGTDFADALAGSYLASVKNAPILLAYTRESVNDGIKHYIRENLQEGGTVYILGGINAVPESFEEKLDGFVIRRLAGAHRFETNLMILEEAGISDKPILVATGLTFADSLSASAAKLPILLVYGDKLLDNQAAFLEENKGRDLYILGGEGAVNARMETVLTAYGTVERVAGNNRFETSVKITEKFFASPESAVLAYAWDFPDGLCGGPLAVTMNAPLILTMEKYESQAAAYIQSNTISKATILGGEKLIPDTSVDLIMK